MMKTQRQKPYHPSVIGDTGVGAGAGIVPAANVSSSYYGHTRGSAAGSSSGITTAATRRASARLRARSVAAPAEASSSSGAPRRAAPGCVRSSERGDRGSTVPSLRAVRIVLDRCDRPSTPVSSNRVEGNNNLVNNIISTANNSAHATPKKPQVDIDGFSIRTSTKCLPASPSASSAVSLGSTGIRILQLNMMRSAAVTGEVRQLIAQKRLDVLLLQELHVKKQGKGYSFVGLGTGMRIAASCTDRPWAAVVVPNPHFQTLYISQLSTTHCAVAEVRAPGFSFYAVSCYFQYSDGIEEHLRHLEMVFRSLRGQRVLVGMDANARSPLWGDRKLDDRGTMLEDLIRSCGCNVHNVVGQPPTYWTARGSSNIDVTLSSPSMSQFVGEWKVRCDWTTSDHNSVDIRLRVPKVRGRDRRITKPRFDANRADWEKFAESLVDLSGSRLEVLDLTCAEDVNKFAETLNRVIIKSCARAMPRKRLFWKSNPWWTKGLTAFKKNVYRARRAYQQERDNSTRLSILSEYRSSLRAYTREVRKAKLESWRKFVTEVGNSEPWGFVYKHQAKKLRVDNVLSTLRGENSSTVTLEETAARLLAVHVPDDRENEDTLEQREIRDRARIAPDTADAPFFTGSEIAAAVRSLKNNKAPGLDLVEVSALKAAFKTIPGQFVRLFNGCLQWGVFPSTWKEGSLRVFLKGKDKDVEDPKSYRPICLLPVIGKLFEKLLMKRLNWSALAPGKISDRQFGFTTGKSTEDAVVELRRMVSASEERYVIALLFDISGAFDNVWWPLILGGFKDRDCPKNIFKVLVDYFHNRRVQISYGDVKASKQATRGCPQGSVLGPACWNVAFDGLLRRLGNRVGKNYIAYADDLLVLIGGNSRKEIEIRAQEVVDEICNWCSMAKLQLSSRKTEAIVLRSDFIRRAPIGRRGGARPDRKRKAIRARKSDLASRPPTIRLGNQRIEFKKVVRYLGIHFDKELGVSTHCRFLSDKVGSLFFRLRKQAGCRWGLRFGALSAIYKGVFAPTVAYAAAGWSDLCAEGDLRVLRTLQRRVLISMTGAYRTASTESLCVAAGAAPIDILFAEYRARYSVRKQENAEIGQVIVPYRGYEKQAVRQVKKAAVGMWQDRWSSSVKGRITHAFFGSIAGRIGARWVKPDRHVTQFITGHGNFRGRLASLGIVDDGMCACGDGEDTVEHHLLQCPLFEAQREALLDFVPVGDWRWPEAAPFLVSSPEAYSVFADFCRETLWIKGHQN